MSQLSTPAYVLPAPISKDEFVRSLPEIYLAQLRQLTLLVPAEQVTGLLPGGGGQQLLLNPERSAEEFGLTAATLPDPNLFETLCRMYDFAYQGLRYAGTSPMGSDGDYTWAAALVFDLQASLVAGQWAGFGAADVRAIAKTCVQVAETANARAVLEGEEGFLSLGRSTGDDGWYIGQGLTIRQMSLLAGMEESSIRTAANPRKPNALKTYHDERGGTRIAPDVAKAWLIAKGRYVVPRTVTGDVAPLDLARREFSSTDDVAEALRQAARHACSGKEGQARARLIDQLEGCGFAVDDKGRWSVGLRQNEWSDEARLQALATALELPVDLFVLRVRQAVAVQALRAVNTQIEASLATRQG